MQIPEIVKSWRLNAAKQQQTFHSLLGDRQWDQLDKSQKYFKNNLKTKISLALFAETFPKCSSAQQTRINTTLERCLQLSGSSNLIHLGYTYVHIFGENEKESILPLIRVKSNYENNQYYVEMQPGKIYENWDQFLQNNNISESYVCYPKNGFYDEQTDKLALLEYNKTSKKDQSAANNLPISVFFPFYKNLHKAEIAPDLKLAQIIIDGKTIDGDPLKQINDKEILAQWLKNMIDDIGKKGIETDTFTSMILDSDVYFKAVRYFRCIYNTSPKVNGHKFIISLMTVLFKHKIGKCNQDDFSDFLAGLNFFLNISAEMNFVKEVVVRLNENPLFVQNFFVSINQSYQQIKKLEMVNFSYKPMKNNYSVSGITHVLKKISNIDEATNNSISYPAVSKRIIDYVKSLGNNIKSNRTIEFWLRVDGNFHHILTEYMEEISIDNEPTLRLKKLWNKIAFPKKEFSDIISNYALPSLRRKILHIFDKIGCNFNTKENIQVQLLEYILELLQPFKYIKDEYFVDLCAIVVEKFITWFDSMAVEIKSKKGQLDKNDVERIVGRVFYQFNKLPTIEQLRENYQQLYLISRSPYISEPAFSTNDMDLYYFRTSNTFGSFDFEDSSCSFVDTVVDHLLGKYGDRELIPTERIHNIVLFPFQSAMVIMFRRNEGRSLYGFLLKITF